MIDLLKIGGYTPPAPTKYDVSFDDVNGAEETLENGDKYKEQIKAQVPKISVSWTNIAESDAAAILDAVSPALFDITYFFGTEKTATVECESPSLTLKYMNGDERYYDLSLSLAG